MSNPHALIRVELEELQSFNLDREDALNLLSRAGFYVPARPVRVTDKWIEEAIENKVFLLKKKDVKEGSIRSSHPVTHRELANLYTEAVQRVGGTENRLRSGFELDKKNLPDREWLVNMIWTIDSKCWIFQNDGKPPKNLFLSKYTNDETGELSLSSHEVENLLRFQISEAREQYRRFLTYKSIMDIQAKLEITEYLEEHNDSIDEESRAMFRLRLLHSQEEPNVSDQRIEASTTLGFIKNDTLMGSVEMEFWDHSG